MNNLNDACSLIVENYKSAKKKSNEIISEIEKLMDKVIGNDEIDSDGINVVNNFFRDVADSAIDKNDADVLIKCQTATRRFDKEKGDLQCYWQIMERSVSLNGCFGRFEAQSLIDSIFDTNEYEMPIRILIKYAKKHFDFKILDACDQSIQTRHNEDSFDEVNKYFKSKVAELIREEIKPKGWPFIYASNKEWVSFEKYAKNWKGKWK